MGVSVADRFVEGPHRPEQLAHPRIGQAPRLRRGRLPSQKNRRSRRDLQAPRGAEGRQGRPMARREGVFVRGAVLAKGGGKAKRTRVGTAEAGKEESPERRKGM